jgi:hypothetical protein
MNNKDCEIILNNVEDVFGELGNCIDTTFDEKKSKTSVVKGLFGLGKSLVKLTFNTGKCAIKYTPKAVVAVAAIKRDIVTSIEEEMQEQRKQEQIEILDKKIQQLSVKG